MNATDRLKPLNPPAFRDTDRAPSYWATLWGPQGNAAVDVADLVAGCAAGVTGGAIGTRNAGCTWAAGDHGPCLAFNGSTGRYTFTGLPAVRGQAITVCATVTVNSFGATGAVLFGSLTGTTYWQIIGATSCAVAATIVTTTSQAWADARPHRVCLVGGPAASKVYKDGVLIGTGAAPANFTAGSRSWTVGDWAGSPGTTFQLNGKLHDLQIFNYTFSQSDVTEDAADPWRRLRAGRRLVVTASASSPSPALSLYHRRRRAG